MPSKFRSALLVCSSALAAACDVEPDALHDQAASEAIALAHQELRFGNFSFADPAVGRLEVGTNLRSRCTGTLIDPQVVVTAAHCVDHRTGPATGTFRIDHSTTVRFTFDVMEVRSFGRQVGNHDVAIVRLRQAVPSSVAVPLGLNPWAIISMHERITMYGYGCRSTQGDAYAGRKQRYDTPFDLTIYGCFGDSGGPLIKTMASGTRVVSKVMSGLSRSRWPGSDWQFEYGLVYRYAWDINDQADIWAGRPLDPRPGGGGGGGGPPRNPDDPPIHQQ